MFPFDRFGAVHLIRIIIEILLITFLHIFGSCRFGIIFGFNDTSSIIFSIIILLMTSTDIYYLLLSLFASEIPRRSAAFHIIFYSLMSLLALICCVFSIIAFIFCIQKKYNRLCPYQSCFILWISIGLTFFLTIMYSASAKLLCCLRGQNID
jgi:hypothetical protein